MRCEVSLKVYVLVILKNLSKVPLQLALSVLPLMLVGPLTVVIGFELNVSITSLKKIAEERNMTEGDESIK